MRRTLSIEVQACSTLRQLSFQALKPFRSLLLGFRGLFLQFRIESLALLARLAEPAAQARTPWRRGDGLEGLLELGVEGLGSGLGLLGLLLLVLRVGGGSGGGCGCC